jgi:hypothetical protein
MDGKKGEVMQRARKTFKAILVVLHVGIVIAVSSWAFAQGGGISGSVKDLLNNQGIQGVIITVKDVSTGTLAGTGTTDALGNYSVGIPALGNYTLEASKPGYNNVSAPDVIELSDMNPNRTVNISMGGNAWLKEKPEVPTSALSWETGAGKSYIIPALEIPAFLLLLNGYDRLAYPNAVEGGKKVYDTNLSTFWDHVVHGHWGGRPGCLRHEPVRTSVSGIHIPWIRAIGGPQLLGVAPLHQRGQLSLGNGRGDHAPID